MSEFEERFWSYVEKTNTCWLWKASKVRGYGQYWNGKKNQKAHRFSYEATHGPLLPDVHLDHLCRTPACVRPDHLEPVSPKENIRRAYWSHSGLPRADFCKKGHNYAKVGFVLEKSGRHCKICRKINYDKKNKKRADIQREKKTAAGLYVLPKRNDKSAYVCKRGHLVQGDNLFYRQGARICRACEKIRNETYRQKKRENTSLERDQYVRRL